MERAVLITTVVALGISVATCAESQTGQCSSYYISGINLVSAADGQAGHVQTFVGFGPFKGRGGAERLRMVLAYQVRS